MAQQDEKASYVSRYGVVRQLVDFEDDARYNQLVRLWVDIVSQVPTIN